MRHYAGWAQEEENRIYKACGLGCVIYVKEQHVQSPGNEDHSDALVREWCQLTLIAD